MSTATTGIASAIRPAFTKRFPFIQPTLPPMETVLALYRPAYQSGMITNASVVQRFEAAVAERLRVAHCIAIGSCTSGLMLTLRALELSGEVILPSLTFFATAHAAVWNGLRPVFADCDPLTWTLDPADAERRITPRTAAIVGVHLYGNPCDIDALSRVAGRHGLPLIYDAAHGFGGSYQGRPVGGFGTAEVFSLTPTKLLIAGEGGLVATNDAALARRIRAARNYGDLGAYDPELLGLSARMPEFNAALGLAGLPLVDRKVARHNQIAARYTAVLSSVPGLRLQQVRAGNVSSFKDYSVAIDARAAGISRDALAAALLAENIETRKYFYPPLHRQKLYRRFYDAAHDSLPCTDFVAGGVLSLPIYDSLPDESVENVALALRRLVASIN
jgi:dTDP-4-amino-4,6-dideoxygalactose transaminase